MMKKKYLTVVLLTASVLVVAGDYGYAARQKKERPPPPTWTSRAVAALCVAVTIKQDISAPYEKIRGGMSMEECYELLGLYDICDQLGSGGNAFWDRGAICVAYSPGGTAADPSEQTVSQVWVRRDYNGFRWFRYSTTRRYRLFTRACDALQRSKQTK
jgi:hypothetical protein